MQVDGFEYGVEDLHEAEVDHAYDCKEIFRKAYDKALAEGAQEHVAYGRAVKAHDDAVKRIFATVGLD